MKRLLILLLPLFIYGVELDRNWINKNYKALTDSQKEVILGTYKQGNLLIIDGEPYGKTIATFTLVESSAGRYKEGDNGNSVGLSHLGYERIKELLKKDKLYGNLLSFPKAKLLYTFKSIDELNVYFTMMNFKENMKRWGNYSKAVKAHNGYNPRKGFHNNIYYWKFVNLMQVVNKVIEER